MQAAEQAWDTCTRQTCLIRLSKRTKHSPSNTRAKEMFQVVWANVWWPSNFFKHDQTQSNTIKQHQTRWPNGKMFGHQTMFDGVWSPNISRLDRPLVSKFTYYKKVWKLSMPSNGCKVLLNLKSTDETLVVLPFKWKLLGSTFMWCCLLCCTRLF